MAHPVNPIEKKIREAGGTIVAEPMLLGCGTDNPAFPDALFAALEGPCTCGRKYPNVHHASCPQAPFPV